MRSGTNQTMRRCREVVDEPDVSKISRPRAAEQPRSLVAAFCTNAQRHIPPSRLQRGYTPAKLSKHESHLQSSIAWLAVIAFAIATPFSRIGAGINREKQIPSLPNTGRPLSWKKDAARFCTTFLDSGSSHRSALVVPCLS